MPDAPVFRWELWQGYLDTLSNLTQTLKEIQNPDFMRKIEEINRKIAAIRLEILSVESYPERWYPLYLKVSGPFWLELSHLLMGLVEISHPAFDQKSLGNLKEITEQVERHHSAVQRTIFELVPWIPFFENAPQPLGEPQFLQTLEELKKSLPYNLALGQIHRQTEAALPHIGVLRRLLKEKSPADRTAGSSPSLTEIGQWQTWQKWVEDLAGTLAHVDASSTALLVRFEQIIARAERYVQEMDFRFLYQPERRVFHIGFNLDAGLLDNNYYDLLASESRIASIIAIAKGEVPQSHWLHLSRPVTRVEGANVLLSWSGTMFEYLMPPLFLRSYPGTLLANSTDGAVRHQIAYGKLKNVPWGISESGFYRFDASKSYQYRAFGVPGLGFKRGLGDDLVIAPYASLMAINDKPGEVAHNLVKLAGYKMIGRYGVYEAIDFTPFRLLLDEKICGCRRIYGAPSGDDPDGNGKLLS